MEESRKERIIKISGLIVLAFAIFSILSVVSYLFTWKADQSLLNDPKSMSADVGVDNLAGKFGAGWGYTLVCRCFGLGSFALVFAFLLLAMKLLVGKRPVFKLVVLSLTATFILSVALAFVSNFTGLNNIFGGGLGGEYGSLLVLWTTNLFGNILTVIIIAILVIAWMFFASDRFWAWFSSLGKEKAEDERKIEEEEEEEVEAEVEEEVKPEKKNTFNWLKKEMQKTEPSVESTETEQITQVSVPEVEPVREVPDIESVPEAKPAVAASAPSENEGETNQDADNLKIVVGEDLSTEVKKDLPRINVRDELKDYRFPDLNLLDGYENSLHEVSHDELKRNNYKIRATLNQFKIEVDNVTAVVGPTVTLYKVYPAPGVKISAIQNLQDDIAMALHAKGVRVVKLADSVGIEVANDKPSLVPLKAMLNDDAFRNCKAELPVAIGYTITQKVKVFDLADAPHLLVAGATKQGKSVGLNVLISSLLYSKHPSELKFVFIDPKMVEFSAYANLLHHYLAVLPTNSESEEKQNAIAKNAKQAAMLLKSLCVEMDARYELLSEALVNNVKLYNEKYKDRHLNPNKGHRYLPYVVVVVDEYADLTMSVGGSQESKEMAKTIEQSIIRLAQKGRAAGLHVVLATQRPSVNVITGLIKSNFPTRIAFRVFSMTDSRTILDSPGAEKLIGKGDMIYNAGVDMERVQCAFISNDEINKINDFIGQQQGYMKSYNTPYYLPEPEPDKTEEGTAMVDMRNLDERFEEAAKLVVMSQKGSTSDLQRKLGMGFAKAGRVMDQLEAAGIVGPSQGSKPRDVLVGSLNELDQIIEAYKKGYGNE